MLTPRQQQVLSTITRLTQQQGSPPTVRELCKAMGTSSPNGMQYHIRALRKAGKLEPQKQAKKHRGIRVIGPCPCCGQEFRKDAG